MKELAADWKCDKYVDLANNHLFVPIAIDSLGLFCSDGITFLIELGHRMTMVTGEVRETAHMFQRLSVAMQHFNRVRFRCSFGAIVYDVGDYI